MARSDRHGSKTRYELVSTRTGTEVHHTADGRLFGIFNVMQPVVAWIARGERGRTLHALKDSLERKPWNDPHAFSADAKCQGRVCNNFVVDA